MQVTQAQQGTQFTLTAENAADHALLDALDMHKHVALQSIQRRPIPEELGYRTTSATLLVDRTSPQALKAQTARQFLRAFRELLRLGLGEDALHSHIGLDTANPQTQDKIAALFEQLQLVVQLGAIAVGQPKTIGQETDASHGGASFIEKPILAQAPQKDAAPHGGASAWSFGLGAPVRNATSGETGVVIGRAQYTNARDGYLVRYRNALGQAIEQWWSADALLEGGAA